MINPYQIEVSRMLWDISKRSVERREIDSMGSPIARHKWMIPLGSFLAVRGNLTRTELYSALSWAVRFKTLKYAYLVGNVIKKEGNESQLFFYHSGYSLRAFKFKIDFEEENL